jgi:MIP family channel proteins
MNYKAYLAEFIGTFTLIFIGVGSILMGGDLLTVAVAHGLAVSIAVSNIGHISGGHINPAVTIGFLVTGKISIQDGVGYIVSQLAGGFVAGLFCVGLLPGAVGSAGIPNLSEGIGTWQAIGIEFILTFFLVFAVFATAVDSRGAFNKLAGFVIGLTVCMDILVGGPLTGAAMNPARVFGPALSNGFWENHWVYWVGPVAGGIAAAVLYTMVWLPDDKEAEEK